MTPLRQNSLILLVCACLTLYVNSKAIPLKSTAHSFTDFKHIPKSLPGWHSQDVEFDSATKRLLPTCSLLHREFVSDTHPGRQAAVIIVYGEDLGDFHEPEFCMQGQGWEILKQETVNAYSEHGRSFDASRLIIQRDDRDAPQPHLVYFWFQSHGQVSTFLGTQKLKMLRDRFLSRQRHTSALVEFWVPIQDSDIPGADTLARSMIQAIVPALNQTLNTTD